MRFSLRALLVGIGLLAVGLWQLKVALGYYADAVALLVGASILAALAGMSLRPLFGIQGRWRALLPIVSGVVAGVLSSFFVIQFEWTGDPGEANATHPWPDSDALYILLAIFRCAVVGGVIGYVVEKTIHLLGGTAQREVRSDAGKRKVNLDVLGRDGSGSGWRRHLRVVGMRRALPALAVAAIIFSWWPYWSLHQEQRATVRLLSAIQASDRKQVHEYARTAKKYRGGADSISGVAYLARNGSDEDVRMTALKALKLLGHDPSGRLDLRPVLDEIVFTETSDEVRAAAAEWLASGDFP